MADTTGRTPGAEHPGATPDREQFSEIHARVKEIVFGTRLSRAVEFEDPAVIVQATRDRIWHNLSSYFVTGDWPDRRRTAEEIDAEAGDDDDR